MHGGDVGSIHAPVDLGALEPPRLHGQRDMAVAVVVVIEGGAFARWIEHAETDHGAQSVTGACRANHRSEIRARQAVAQLLQK